MKAHKKHIARGIDFTFFYFISDIFLQSFSFEYVLLILFFYFYICWFLFKQTIGDKIFKLKLVTTREDGKFLWYQVLLKMVLFIPFLPIIVFQNSIFSDNKKPLLHDKIAKLDVIEIK